jgi:Flp pilus assembly protein protease CpaA
MLTGLILLLIAFFDFLRHRIPNLLLLLLILSIVTNGDIHIQVLYAIIVSVISLLAYWKCGVGAGDVKLLSIVALFLTPAHRIIEYWLLFSMIGSGLALLKWSSTHSFKGNIALAPAVCGAVLCISSLNYI